jgi:hypothetical protein
MVFDPVHSPSARNRATAPVAKVSARNEKRKSAPEMGAKQRETIDLTGSHD